MILITFMAAGVQDTLAGQSGLRDAIWAAPALVQENDESGVD